MIEIPLTQGYVALIDDEDAHLAQHSWYANIQTGTVYAQRNVSKADGKQTTVMLHRVVMNAPKDMLVDHRNGNGLDNRRSNLRLATDAENAHNQRIRRDNTSGFKGVYWHKRDKKWMGRIMLNGKLHYLGYFSTPEAAAAAYDKAALELHGDFANLNAVNEPMSNERTGTDE